MAKAAQLVKCWKCGESVGVSYLARHLKTCEGNREVKAVAPR